MHGIAFNYSIEYHLKIDGQTEVINLNLEQYLRCFSIRKRHAWTRWLVWDEFCYKVNITLRSRDQLLKERHLNFYAAQQHIKSYADLHT